MSRTPLWKSIADELTADIAEGRHAPGSKLPTEAQLAARFGVNRHTVRRAMAELAEEGLVHARRGAGVFVAAQPTDYPIGTRVRFARNLYAAGRLPSRKVLALTMRGADGHEARSLNLEPGAQLHVYEGISLADEQPLAIFRTCFPADRFPELPAILRADPSITSALRQVGVKDYIRVSTRVTAVQATATDARHLQIRQNAPLLCTESVSTDTDGVPVEFGRTWFAGERVALTIGNADLPDEREF
ncbi:phosphonate metabolism transcriptional regulator PhnF [Chachezhania antarctica]|mgnify:CR=1 FL=1|uniref:phosphonate metabolism transcriptional regulator PhnF n=1 Tax=Chachezhania antarctica TaxID=2340860 RepID=UPI000EB17262|nr:phosphonate metabolism transcriptional regulator PhnF [Chachezhania antarctica]|tara:strand:+ start:9924 stop:10658 length:735 start_codon:yes stop_codon:yes gene_type:complete